MHQFYAVDSGIWGQTQPPPQCAPGRVSLPQEPIARCITQSASRPTINQSLIDPLAKANHLRGLVGAVGLQHEHHRPHLTAHSAKAAAP
jgi:hypothetical protein